MIQTHPFFIGPLREHFPPAFSTNLIIVTHTKNNLPVIDHFEVKKKSPFKLSQTQGLTKPFKVRKDHQGTDRIT